MPEATLTEICDEVVACSRCPRLVEWRSESAAHPPARFAHEAYWARPLPGFGDPRATILLVGLAPAAHGGNRTGRMFTGDRSGEFLFGAMHRTGLASRSTSVAADDGLELTGAYVSAVVRCAPPDNKPTPDEIARCAPFLDRELDALPRARVLVALGAIAWRAILDHLARRGASIPRPLPTFGHGARTTIASTRDWTIFGSYHVSQQNTQTGKLTPKMFDAVISEALRVATHP